MVFPIHSFLSPTSPFPTRWLPRLVRHFSRGTMRMLRLPAAPPVALRFSSNNGYLLASISFRSPRAPGVAPAAPGRWSTGFASTTPVLFMEEASRISQVPRVPFRAFALLSDPGRISTPSLLRRFDSAPAVQTTKAPTSGHYFEAQSHGFSSRSIRFVPASLPTTQCSLPAGGQPLPGGILYPLGPCIVFPSLVFYSITCSSSHSGFT